MTATPANTVVRFVPTEAGVSVRMEVDMETGEVTRYGGAYRAKLSTPAARELFLAGVGIVWADEVADFILACNRAAIRKTLTTAAARLDAACRATGLPMVGPAADVKAAKPHASSCACSRCAVQHVRRGCRRIGCPVCG